MRAQHGFTLLELMVAMAIFAMLAVAGWQVFDGVNRARERAQFHADNLAVLQYAYLQLQQDMGQMIPYQALDTQKSNSSSNNAATNNANNSNQENVPAPEPFMSLDGERVSFVRFTDPDPRYQSSASLQHIEYIFADERLIRRQYVSLGSDSISLDSILLDGVTAGRWQAHLPEVSAKFPNKDNRNNISNNTPSGQLANSANAQPEVMLLPKGIVINFTYQDMPITWQWALTPQPIPNISKNTSNNPNGSNNNNNNSNSNNNSNDGINNGNEANGNVENNNSGNSNENAPFGQ
ncbi:type II secretion system minor pseudopilin GspJ [Psychrobacter sp. ANT_WB68]|uniref:type II secretion system minor pseudopilin GspJ n=1 Tax=Psychrobacter sp. ANT_WB68 TaxID=2597355 RepID=UPI0011F32C4E|nr:type II secretion system minor pseudopilin GspJ [Psychrobacter sp. ANT_WB68]KAA0914251.1 type II secretion system protein GspJ [Psychrobacter sp. ANT_WB68]